MRGGKKSATMPATKPKTPKVVGHGGKSPTIPDSLTVNHKGFTGDNPGAKRDQPSKKKK